MQAAIFTLWDKYSQGGVTASQMLRACSRVNGQQIELILAMGPSIHFFSFIQVPFCHFLT